MGDNVKNNSEYTVNKLDFNSENLDFTKEKKNELTNFDQNFYLIFKIMLKKLLTSTSFWISLVFGLLAFAILDYIIFESTAAYISFAYEDIYSQFSHGLNIDEWINLTITPEIFNSNFLHETSVGGFYYTREYLLVENFIYTFTIFFPILVMTLLTFPSFLILYRDSNLLKSLKMRGVSKIQFFSSYVLISFLIVSFYLLIIFLVVMPIINILISNSVYNTYQEGRYYYYEYIDGDFVGGYDIDYFIDKSFFDYFLLNPWFIFNNFYSGTNFLHYIFVMLLGMFVFILVGYYIGSSFKSIKGIIGILVFVLILQIMISLTTPYNFNKDVWVDHSDNGAEDPNFISNLILFISKYLFILTPFTIINKAVLLTSNASIYQSGGISEDFYSNRVIDDFWMSIHNNGNNYYNIVIYLSIVLSVIIIGLIVWKFSEITKYETLR